MKYLLFIVLLMAVIITGGCTTVPIKTPVTTTSTQAPPILLTKTTELQTTIASSIPSTSPTPSFTIPKRVEDLNEQNQCQVMVACGQKITAGQCSHIGENETGIQTDNWCIIYAKDNPDPICQKAVWMNTYIKNCLKSNPYQASANTAVECSHCYGGVGDLEACLNIADKCGISRDTMKSMYCETNSC
jgi:hypothetical protein